MTKLDRTLTETLLRARWPESNGQPVCPKHYDGHGVEPDQRPKHHDGLPTYWCRCCITRFNPATQTVMARTKKPLWMWALAFWPEQPAERTWPPARRAQVRACRRAWAQGTQLGPRWFEELKAAGVKIGDLLKGHTAQ